MRKLQLKPCRSLCKHHKFDSIEEAQELLSFYWMLNGRKPGSEVDIEIEYKVVIFTGRSGDKSMEAT